MPNEVFTNQGLLWVAKTILQQIPQEDLQIVLLTDTTPFDVTDVPADHTPNTLTGGEPKTLGSSDWVTAVSAGTAVGYTNELVWAFDAYAGGVTIQQYMLIDSSTGLIIIWGGALPTPYVVPSGGGGLNLVVGWPMELCTP